MAATHPCALIVDRNPNDRQLVSELLREVGFAVETCAPTRVGFAPPAQRRFDLVVIAGDGRESDVAAASRRARVTQPQAKVLVLAPRGSRPLAGAGEHVRVVARPLDPRRLHAVLRELMTRDECGIGHNLVDLGMIEAQLACLRNRWAEAERCGATSLAGDIAHQIGAAVAARQSLLPPDNTAAEAGRG